VDIKRESAGLIASAICGLGSGLITTDWKTRIGITLIWVAFLFTIHVFTEKKD
jgi:hypothetical protein